MLPVTPLLPGRADTHLGHPTAEPVALESELRTRPELYGTMILGFTGTRQKVTDVQMKWLSVVFNQLTIHELHHGACVGADQAAHILALQHGIPIVVHPPVNPTYLAALCLTPQAKVTILAAKPYLNRNRDIVGATEGIVALPQQLREPPPLQWGGTWYTVDYAVRLNKSVVICYSDGRIEKRNSK